MAEQLSGAEILPTQNQSRILPGCLFPHLCCITGYSASQISKQRHVFRLFPTLSDSTCYKMKKIFLMDLHIEQIEFL